MRQDRMRWQWQSAFLWISLVTAVILTDSTFGRSLQLQAPENVQQSGPSAVRSSSVVGVRFSDGLIRYAEVDPNSDEKNYMDQLQPGYQLINQDPLELQRDAPVDASNGINENRPNYVREPRAAVYKGPANEMKHVDRIPAVKSSKRVRHGTTPPPDQSDEDDFDTLEANREAFLEVLNDHAKHPHRRRSSKRHNEKFVLKYDYENNRYSLTELQSEEF